MVSTENFMNDLPAEELIRYYTDLYRQQTAENPFFDIPLPDEEAIEKTSPSSGSKAADEEITTPDGFIIRRGESFGTPYVGLLRYTGTDETAVVPDGVTGISWNCFTGTTLKKVIIPEGISGVSHHCFSSETLESIADPDGFCIAGPYLIKYLGSDDSVIVPEGVTEIAEAAFEKNETITSVHIPQSVRVIGRDSFNRCKNLSSVIFAGEEAELESIGENAFASCPALLSFNLARPVGHIGANAFSWCDPVTDSLGFAMIGSVLVKYTGNDNDVMIPDGVRIIGPGAFLQTKIVKVTIPEGVYTIGTSAFHACMSLMEAKLPSTVKTIDDRAFIACRSLTAVNAESAERIGANAFESCSVKEMTLSDNLRSIGSAAFKGCVALKGVNVIKGGTIVKNMLPGSLASISNQLFSGCYSLQSLTVPGTIDSIGFEAFASCSQLEKVILSEGIRTMGKRCFFQTGALASLDVPSTVESIGENAFRYSACCKAITLPEALADRKTFYGIPDKNGCFVENGILTGYSTVGNGLEIIISEGVIIIGEQSLPLGWGMNTVDPTRISLPDSVRLIRQRGYGFLPKFKMNIPRGYLLQRSKLPAELLKALLDTVWKKEATMADWASVYLFQNSKPLKELCMEMFTSAPNAFAAAFLAILRAKSTPGEIVRTAELIYDLRGKISQELLDQFFEYAKERKAKKAISILSPFVSGNAAGETAKPVRTYRNELEEFCDKNFEKHDFERIMKKAGLKKTLFEKSSVKYAGSNKPVSDFVLQCAVLPYIGQMTERPKAIGSYKTFFIHFTIMNKCDEIASKFESASFSAFLDKLEKQANRFEKVQIWAPICRYGSADRMKALISDMNAWSDWNKCGASGRSGIMVAAGALMLSDTREAMMYAEKRGQLVYYAKIRGTTADTIRDTKLADFGFDENGKKAYDLGSTVIDASVGNDLTVSLYDTATGKIVKSLPKKNADPSKFDVCSADYADLKKNVKKVVKARNDLLFEYFLSGKKTEASAWIAAYTGNPVLNKVARLLVWSQNKKTFTLGDTGAIDSDGNSYEIDRSGTIVVAHPLEMKEDDILRWQKYFVSAQLKQPFEQIWEPKIDINTVKPDRYKGCMIPYYRFLHQEKHGITVTDIDFHNDINIYPHGLDATIKRIDWARHNIDMNDRFEITSIKVEKLSRSTNHLIFYFDKCTTFGRIANDDDSILASLRGYTVAQIDAFLKYAIENKCTKCAAGLLDFKNKYFADFAEVDEFTLD